MRILISFLSAITIFAIAAQSVAVAQGCLLYTNDTYNLAEGEALLLSAASYPDVGETEFFVYTNQSDNAIVDVSITCSGETLSSFSATVDGGDVFHTITDNLYCASDFVVSISGQAGEYGFPSLEPTGAGSCGTTVGNAEVVSLSPPSVAVPTLSINIYVVFEYAFDIVNAFMPLIAIVLGLALGLHIVQKLRLVFNK